VNRIFLRLAPLPTAVKGVTLPDSDGDYTVFINADLCPETREKVIEHEMSHIQKNHFSDMLTVVEAEQDAE
jgi:hypothetical protein